jgi:putative protease
VKAREGERLISTWSINDDPQAKVMVRSRVPLQRAEKRGVSIELLREQFGRLGNTPYELREVTLEVEGAPFVSASVLNQMRRDAVDALQALQGHPRKITIHHAEPSFGMAVREQALNREPQIHLLVRTPEQLEAALALRPASITLDYLDLYGLRPSVERVKASGIAARVASPRVMKPGESRIRDFLMSLECGILVRPAGLLEGLREENHPELTGDFSLNVASSVTAELYLEMGLTRITPAHDLNAAQVADLAVRTGAEPIEAIAYQHLPVFHTEHCVFCRFLSSGTSYRDCGRPCEKHQVALKDSRGRAHPVLADVGCRNTVFGAEAQEASGHLEAWRRAGIRHFRLEFVHESADEVRRVHECFDAALSGRISARELASRLRAIAPQGVTEGSLFVPADYMKLPVLQ